MPMFASLLLFLAQNPQGQPAGQTGQEPRFISQRYFQLKDLATTKITFREKTPVTCWIMDEDMKRAEGMMFLKDEDWTEKQGMIFVFSRGQELRFWMRNTLVPLDIAYVSESGKILSTYTMKALDETTDYSSHGMAKYAIELKAGFLRKNLIQVGDMVQIPSTVKSKD